MSTLSILILSAVVIAISEVFADRFLWLSHKNDKPLTTIIRGCIIALIAIWLCVPFDWLKFAYGIAVMLTVYATVFDPMIGWTQRQFIPLPYYKARTKFQRALDEFMGWFFYHGDEDTKSWYDKAFQRIPPIGELLFKGIAIYVSVYLYTSI